MPTRVHIDGKWSAAEFAALFETLDALRNFYANLFDFKRIEFEWFAYPREPAGAYRIFRYPLEVKRLEVASAGFTELVGLAAAMRKIRELIRFLITHASNRQDRLLDRRQKEIEIARQRLSLLTEVEKHRLEHRILADYDADDPKGTKRDAFPDLTPLIDAVFKERITGTNQIVEK